MFCRKCGKEIDDEAMICPFCGCATSNLQSDGNNENIAKEDSSIAILSIVFAAFIPIVGFILGIIGIRKYKNGKNKKKCIIAITLSVVVVIAFTICTL